MSGWSLAELLAGLHEEIETQLSIARKAVAHPGSKGDASEEVWLELLERYLPKRYQAQKAHVVDSEGSFSQQMDVVVFDRQYSPFIFNFKGQLVVPAEAVYAVFEAKQTINAALVAYAQEKVASVRRLARTSLPIPYAGGTHDPKPPHHIIGGLLTFESEWTPCLGKPLKKALAAADDLGVLDVGCVAAHGVFLRHQDRSYGFHPEGKPASAFLFELIARLQATATVPMIDVRAYARWLNM